MEAKVRFLRVHALGLRISDAMKRFRFRLTTLVARFRVSPKP